MAKVNYIPSIIEQYVDDIPFLYQYRELALRSPVYNIDEIEELDNRLKAHIFGLVMIGEEAWDLCQESLSADNESNVFTLSIVAIALKNLDYIRWIFEEIGEEFELLKAVSDAFVYYPFEQVKNLLRDVYELPLDTAKYVVVSAFRNHRVVSEKLLEHALTNDSDWVKQATLESIAVFALSQFKSTANQYMEHENSAVSFAACCAAARFGNAEAIQKLEQFTTDPQYAETALHYVVMQKDMNHVAVLLRKLFENDDSKRLAILGLGFVGRANSLHSLIGLMDKPETARIAGYSFSLITGVDLETNHLVREAPPDFSAGPSEDAEDDDVAMDPDEDLPWPDAQKVAQWWEVNQQRFAADKRYILGKELSVAALRYVLKHGLQKQRIFAANVLALYEHDQPIFNVFSGVKKQRILLQ